MKLVCILLLSLSSVFSSSSISVINPVQVSIDDFKTMVGTHTGQLIYKDYTGGEMVSLTLVGASYLEQNKFVMEHLMVEGGQLYNHKYSLSFENGKAIVNGTPMQIVSSNFSEDVSKKQIVLTNRGKDGNDNKACTFKYTLTYEGQKISLVKEVKYDGAKDFFIRNKYLLNQQS